MFRYTYCANLSNNLPKIIHEFAKTFETQKKNNSEKLGYDNKRNRKKVLADMNSNYVVLKLQSRRD